MKIVRYRRISPAAAWIVFCVFCSVAGWVLSALHALNRTGYAISFLAGLAAVALWWSKTQSDLAPVPSWPRFRGRFRRPFPLAFLILAGLAVLGGLLHPPTNYDALSYRTPRVFHWLAEQRWHWIHADFPRLNTRGCAVEWVTAPLFLWTGTDRLGFVLNAICFLLFPGRIFSVLRGLGVAGRTAWYWMWLLPAGYGFLLQAGSIANDLFGTVGVLIAFEFALRARREKRIGLVWISVLAAGLMTSSKAFNLVLLAPWAFAVFPTARLLLQRPLASLGVMIAGAAASLLPTAILNTYYCGDWTGLAAEPIGFGSGPLWLHVTTNLALVLLTNFAPPIFPLTHAWAGFVQQVVPASLSALLHLHFEPDGASFKIGEMQMEESSGMGMGVSLLLLHLLILQLRSPGFSLRGLLGSLWRYEILISLGAWGAAFVFMARSGLYCPARYLLPFYVLLITPLLRGAAPRKLTYHAGWRKAAFGTFLLAGLVLILTPPRPLWPATSILSRLGGEQAAQPLVRRAWSVYSVYQARGDAFAQVRAVLPPDANPLGVVTMDDPEASLWTPLGSRRILHIARTDGPADIRARGIRYALVSSFNLAQYQQTSVEDWLSRQNAEVIQRLSLTLLAARGPTDWYLVKFRP